MIFTVSAVLLNIIGWVFYLRCQFKRSVRPNPITTLLSCCIISATTLSQFFTGNLSGAAFYCIGLIPALVTARYALKYGVKVKLTDLPILQKIAALVSVASILCFFVAPSLSTLALIAYYLTAYYLMLSSMIKGDTIESLVVWSVWSLSSIVNFVNALLNSTTVEGILIPSVTMLCWCSVVLIILLQKYKLKRVIAQAA